MRKTNSLQVRRSTARQGGCSNRQPTEEGARLPTKLGRPARLGWLRRGCGWLALLLLAPLAHAQWQNVAYTLRGG